MFNRSTASMYLPGEDANCFKRLSALRQKFSTQKFEVKTVLQIYAGSLSGVSLVLLKLQLVRQWQTTSGTTKLPHLSGRCALHFVSKE